MIETTGPVAPNIVNGDADVPPVIPEEILRPGDIIPDARTPADDDDLHGRFSSLRFARQSTDAYSPREKTPAYGSSAAPMSYRVAAGRSDQSR